MSGSDTLADFITAIRNASAARKEAVEAPFSNLKYALAKALQDLGYVAKVDPVVRKGKKWIRISLRYTSGKSGVMSRLVRVSRSGRRVYAKSNAIPRVRGGLGGTILSTSKGVMTDRRARQLKLGGEILCTVW